MKITVKAGEMLYLPSLWGHFVEQRYASSGDINDGEKESEDTMRCAMAVNFWFDMDFSDARYTWYTSSRELGRMASALSDQ
jgi:hypothetical protein